ncbi:Type I restriction modification DNA specificity domain [Metamycoplasma alkalescens]|uniref:Type I restriction modification DNA specificity domain n=1 Tax=Metamycoplasma alkalescens TaxID=45363 RepID=A0A3B0P419_9BACT|nr:Type I restriction modification DNA specificity domain [Metamycoplasma alkalescens]
MVNILNYEQPTKYIVKSSKYVDKGIPVLTAGKTLILGHTTDKENVKIVSKFNPIIIFDDFTTSSHFIDFPFKIKSSAMKLLTNHNNNDNIYFNFLLLKNLKYIPEGHNRHWISKFTDFKVITTKYEEKNIISSLLQNMDSLITLHQRKLDMLKNFKNTLLNKMFV